MTDPTTSATPTTVDVYSQIGGAPAMSAFVKELHKRLVADSITSPYFAHMDQATWRAHRAALRSFLAAALGGPKPFRGKSMLDAHAHVGVTTAAFDRLVIHAVAILRDMGVPDALIGHVGEAITPLRPHIVQAAG